MNGRLLSSLLALAAFALACGACADIRETAPSSREAGSDTALVRGVLLAEMRHLASDRDFPKEIDSTLVFLTSIPSRAVSGMTYHWGEISSGESDVGGIMALVATRDTSIRVVRNIVDWSIVARGWDPNSREEAARACAELYRIQYRGGPRDQATVYGLDTLPTFPVLPGQREWLRKELPDTFIVEDVRSGDSFRRVRLWVINPEISSIADEIACELPSPMWVERYPANLAIYRRR